MLKFWYEDDLINSPLRPGAAQLCMKFRETHQVIFLTARPGRNFSYSVLTKAFFKKTTVKLIENIFPDPADYKLIMSLDLNIVSPQQRADLKTRALRYLIDCNYRPEYAFGDESMTIVLIFINH